MSFSPRLVWLHLLTVTWLDSGWCVESCYGLTPPTFWKRIAFGHARCRGGLEREREREQSPSSLRELVRYPSISKRHVSKALNVIVRQGLLRYDTLMRGEGLGDAELREYQRRKRTRESRTRVSFEDFLRLLYLCPINERRLLSGGCSVCSFLPCIVPLPFLSFTESSLLFQSIFAFSYSSPLLVCSSAFQSLFGWGTFHSCLHTRTLSTKRKIVKGNENVSHRCLELTVVCPLPTSASC